jgi:very-short-patch-repair endonuclease
LAIEIDGGQHAHEENMLYDAEREQHLTGLDITTLRFWNSEVSGSLSEVLEKIKSEIRLHLPLK